MENQAPWSDSAALQLLHDKAVGRRTGEYGSYKNMCSPQRMLYGSAAAQVFDLKAQVTVPVVCLKHCVVGKWTKELQGNTDI